MAVLGDAAGQEYRERDYPGSEKGHEYHMWPRLRNNADKGGKKYHQCCVVADPVVYIHKVQDDSQYQQDSECPCEYCREMLLYNMIPEVFFNEMIRCEYQHDKHDHAQSCKQHVHPILAEEVDRVAVPVVMGVYMGMIVVVAHFCVYMAVMLMSFMCRMIMS